MMFSKVTPGMAAGPAARPASLKSPSDPKGSLAKRLHQRTASTASGGEASEDSALGGEGILAGMLRPVCFSSNDGDELLGGLPRVVVLEGGSVLSQRAAAAGTTAAGVRGAAAATFAVDSGVHEEDRVALIPS